VDEAWQALDSGSAAPAIAPGATRLIVWRAEDTIVYHRGVDKVEAGLMLLLVDGAPFGVLCERLTRGLTDDEATRLAFELLSRWVNDGLLADGRR
jgi:hypothetical protein